MRLDQVAAAFLLNCVDGVDEIDQLRDQGYDGPCHLIDADRIDDLADAVMRFVAEVVVEIIDAGSEREAVAENDELREAIRKELSGWDSTEWRRQAR